MTKLPADMEGRVEAFIRWMDPCNTKPFSGSTQQIVSDLRALLKAYQEQRRALEDLLALPVAARSLAHLDKGIGTKTPDAAWLRARTALNQKGDER
jgi:hypothetical protein